MLGIVFLDSLGTLCCVAQLEQVFPLLLFQVQKLSRSLCGCSEPGSCSAAQTTHLELICRARGGPQQPQSCFTPAHSFSLRVPGPGQLLGQGLSASRSLCVAQGGGLLPMWRSLTLQDVVDLQLQLQVLLAPWQEPSQLGLLWCGSFLPSLSPPKILFPHSPAAVSVSCPPSCCCVAPGH